jgi:hypothetical protein
MSYSIFPTHMRRANPDFEESRRLTTSLGDVWFTGEVCFPAATAVELIRLPGIR